MPTGHGWGMYLPTPEYQDQYLATEACASFNTLAPVKTLEKQAFGDTQSWSDRFLAKQSGTTQSGNDPWTVAETLRKGGVVYSTDWPYTPDLTTWDAFYANIPFQTVVNGQVEFKGKYNFGHQYVGADPQSMMNALKMSPLGVGVFAWNNPDANGIYQRNGGLDCHWTMIYDFVENEYWMVQDSYPPYQKKLAWNFGFTDVQGYTLNKQVVQNTLWAQAIRWLAQFIPGLTVNV